MQTPWHLDSFICLSKYIKDKSVYQSWLSWKGYWLSYQLYPGAAQRWATVDRWTERLENNYHFKYLGVINSRFSRASLSLSALLFLWEVLISLRLLLSAILKILSRSVAVAKVVVHTFWNIKMMMSLTINFLAFSLLFLKFWKRC